MFLGFVFFSKVFFLKLKVVYSVKVKSLPIKKRISEHLTDARNYTPERPKGSRLSHYIGNLNFNNIQHTLNWTILSQKKHFSPVANFCLLCNVEKVYILYHPEFASLNLRNELYGYCFHKERYLLLNSWYVLHLILLHFLSILSLLSF